MLRRRVASTLSPGRFYRRTLLPLRFDASSVIYLRQLQDIGEMPSPHSNHRYSQSRMRGYCTAASHGAAAASGTGLSVNPLIWRLMLPIIGGFYVAFHFIGRSKIAQVVQAYRYRHLLTV